MKTDENAFLVRQAAKKEKDRDALLVYTSDMHSLCYSSLLAYLPFLREELVGKHLSSPSYLLENVFAFRISGKGSRKLVLSLRNEAPLIYFGEKELDLHSLSCPFFESFKKELPNPYVESISLLNEDRILSFSLLCLSNVYKEQRKRLVLELFPGKANLLLLDDKENILLVLRPKGLETNRPLLRGMRYSLPARGNFISSESASFSLSGFQEESKRYEEELLEKRKKERFAPFVQEYEKKERRAAHKIEAIERDIEEAKKHLSDAKWGDAIYMCFDSIEKGSDSFYFEGERIPLNPSLRPQENAERYYKRAKKAKETLARSETNLQKAKKEMEEAKDTLFALKNGQEEALEKMLMPSKKVKGKEPKFGSASLPYFVEVDGTKILFGKSAKQNDCLTFLLETAKKHLWFHILGESGPHVILKTDVPNEKLIDVASQVALFLAGYSEGEVQIAYRKDIRKGAFPGQAVLKEYRTKRIERVDPKVSKLLDTAKKVSD